MAMEEFPFGTAYDTSEAGPVFNTVPAPGNSPPIFTDGPNSGHTYQVGVYGTKTTTATGTPQPQVTTFDQPPQGLEVVEGLGELTISGTPGTGTAGAYLMNLVATNGVDPDSLQQFLIIVNP